MSEQNFKNLIFEGGGVKGIAYGGALTELERLGVLSGIERVAGTSAGAITAVLLAVGYSHQEVSDIVADTDFNKFADDSIGIVRDARRLISHYGVHKGDVFRKWIGRLIANKQGKKDLTFAQLNEKKNTLALYLVATNLSDQAVEIFSHEHSPNVPIRDAVRMSMSIPLYFKCVRYGEDKDIVVDGGVSLNYPLNLFDHTRYLSKPENGLKVDYNTCEGYVFNHETLGFRLDSKNEIECAQNSFANVPKDIDNFVDYAEALLSFIYSMANKKHLHSNDWNRTVFIDTKGVQTTEFDLGKDKISALISSGQQGVTTHFSWRRKHNIQTPY